MRKENKMKYYQSRSVYLHAKQSASVYYNLPVLHTERRRTTITATTTTQTGSSSLLVIPYIKRIPVYTYSISPGT